MNPWTAIQEEAHQKPITAAVAAYFDQGEAAWTHKAWGRTVEGLTVHIEDLRDPDIAVSCLCLGGAIRRAIAEHFGFAMGETGGLADELCRLYCAAGDIDPTDDREPFLNAVIDWNDAPGRTFDEVRALAHATAFGWDSALARVKAFGEEAAS